jgi:spectinomycin phosphotransferase
MREQPDISEMRMATFLHGEYGFQVDTIRYLPIGYDMNAYVFEAIATDRTSYFVKIRTGALNPASLAVPRMLIERGIPNILAPIRTLAEELSSSLDVYSLVVYPFIHGDNAMMAGLSDEQWMEFGATLRSIHTGGFASTLQGQVPAETFSLPSARLVRQMTSRIDGASFDSPAATRLAAFWRDKTALISHLLERAEALGKQLQLRPFEYVLCHADIHAANILVGVDNRIYLIDWDGPLLAPRERDLLFVVGSRIARRVEPHEEALFFRGYGAVDVDLTALAYYRYERVIEDIGEMVRSVLFTPDRSEQAREAEAELFYSQFQPGGTVESAMDADRKQASNIIL